ncbi:MULTISPECIES: hypothetical protein [unclassified Lentimicrobium]|uniref:hypothetical protein n=1 Tax=unclassified Lentimicrobium TaxID=2677434 RepID=UPI001C12FC82|nr:MULTISPECIES: hypothetical protein [unclassified Lentimicrobium]
MDEQELLEQGQFEQLIQGLLDDNYGCCDDFYPAQIIDGLRNNMKDLYAAGNMKHAGIGRQKDFQKDKRI